MANGTIPFVHLALGSFFIALLFRVFDELLSKASISGVSTISPSKNVEFNPSINREEHGVILENVSSMLR